jgi:hypothetical protein
MEWISVKDRLPKLYEDVLLYDGYEVFAGNIRGIDKENLITWKAQPCDSECYGWYKDEYITHWMPLPEPPKK